MKTNHFLTISELNPTNEGKGGKAGYFEITNTTFVAGIFPDTPSGAFAAICSKPGDPSVGGWMATLADDSVVHLSSDNNNYINCSSFIHDVDGSFKARKSQFAACHFLMLDDIGTKVSFDLLTDFELSWLIETSPGNHQGGIILAEPITDGNVAIQLLDALINAGLCDKGASGPLSRWARLPVAINGKPKYVTESGESFKCRLVEWQLDKRYTPEEIIKLLKLEITPTRLSKKASTTSPTHGLSIDSDDDDVLMPKAAENPVISVLKARGLYKTPLGSGKHDITCPWLLEHTDELDTGSAYFEPDDTYPLGGFCCQHSHGGKLHIRELLEYLGVPQVDARHKSVIKIIPGDLHRVIEVAEKELAALGKHYQAGGLIVSVST